MKKGKWIVHSTHGVGFKHEPKLVKIMEQELMMVQLDFEQHGLTVQYPITQVLKQPIRDLSTLEEATKAFQYLQTKKSLKPLTHKDIQFIIKEAKILDMVYAYKFIKQNLSKDNTYFILDARNLLRERLIDEFSKSLKMTEKDLEKFFE